MGSSEAPRINSVLEGSDTPSAGASSVAEDALVEQVVTQFVGGIWKPIKKRIHYCLQPETHVRNLERSADDLNDAIDIVQEKIQVGEREGKRPRTQVLRWIENAQEVNFESDRIKNDYEGRSKHAFGYSWNFTYNHSISSAATKTLIDINEIKRRTPQNDSIFSLLPPVGRELPLPPNIVGQDRYMDKIICYIKQGTTSIIGICGIGGSGKTTLLKQVNNIFSRAAETHDFNHVIYVEVGQQQNLPILQQSIASQLGLTLAQDENTSSRSASLYNFLKESKFLLLLDDLWETLDLEKVGIPQGCSQIGPQNRQLMIITTRLQQVVYGMKGHAQMILLKSLDLNEASSLFEANAGTRLTNNEQIWGYAKRIVKKCGGLPLALKIVGKVMASKERVNEWEHALTLLEQSQFDKVPEAGSLYAVLYISYNQLPDERTKQCFLLFALASYHITHLAEIRTIELWLGHGLLDENDDTRNSYLRGHFIVGCLKNSCLLEIHPQREKFLMMHDCIRDLAFWIVETKHGGRSFKNWLVSDTRRLIDPKEWSTAERIHLNEKHNVKIPDSCSYPHLLTLLLGRYCKVQKVPAGLFAAAPSLTYLDLKYARIQELPSDVGALVNLQHLDLSHSKIHSLPIELQQLKSLRYLYLRFTRRLRTIPLGTISALSMLKVLDLYCCYFLQTRAHIEELESHASLQFLGYSIADFDLFRRILKSSRVSFGSLQIKEMEGLKRLHVSPIESLEGFQIDKMRVQQLERLDVNGIRSLKELVMGETNVDPDWHFRSLVELQLVDLTNLKRIIWKGVVPRAFFPGLRELVILGCHSIKAITWVQQLPCLEEIHLLQCRSLLTLVSDDDEAATSPATASFPCLRLLGLSDVQCLQNISRGRIELPCLQRLLVYKCPKLEIVQSEILCGEHMPLIVGERDWWEKLQWEDRLSSLFREISTSFEGSFNEAWMALGHHQY